MSSIEDLTTRIDKGETDFYSTNESLLQSYRRIFISTESFLLTVGLFAYGLDNLVIFFALVIFNFFIISCLWIPIVRWRALIVDYYKFNINKIVNCQSNEKKYTLKDYLKKPDKRQEANKEIGLISNWRETRSKIDIALPILFLYIWYFFLNLGIYRILFKLVKFWYLYSECFFDIVRSFLQFLQ